jgi:hypothetical protein
VPDTCFVTCEDSELCFSYQSRLDVVRLKMSFTVTEVHREIGLFIIETGRNFVMNIDFSLIEKCTVVMSRFK